MVVYKKICTRCREEKPVEEFAAGITMDGRQQWCKRCCSAYQKERRYGLPPGGFDRMREAQGYCCAICGKGEEENEATLWADTHPETGKIRGLLCVACSKGLRSFMKDRGIVAKVLDYLDRY